MFVQIWGQNIFMKGIILAGGAGTRLRPITLAISKHLLPIYDKPMIYYPLSVLMLAGIREILIITTEEDNENFQKLLGDGSRFGIRLQYSIQAEPKGLAEAFIIGEEFIAGDNVCLILGDNLFFGQGFTPVLEKVVQHVNEQGGAFIFAYPVKEPKNFGVIEFDSKNQIISIEEKPLEPKSNYAATGLYFFDNQVIEFAKQIKPSARGELEITDLNNMYLAKKQLNLEFLGRGFAWLDAGTHDSLIDAGQFVQTIEQRQGFKIACLEEIGYQKKWLTKEDVQHAAEMLGKSGYGDYLNSILKIKHLHS